MLINNFVGIDVSKSTFDAALIVQGKCTKGKFSNSLKGFMKFLEWAQSPVGQTQFCLESTGPYSRPLADFLFENKQAIFMVNPLRIKNYARSQLARNKNDRYDAQIIGNFLATFHGSLRPYRPKSQAQLQLRELVNLYDALVDEVKGMKIRLHIASSEATKTYLTKALKVRQEEKKLLEKSMKELIKQDKTLNKQANLLMSIRCVGIGTTCRLLAYIQDIHEFKTAKQLASFAGLSPQQKSSGLYQGKTKMSKIGDRKLRTALYMSAMQSFCRNEDLQPFVARLRKKGLSNMAIIGAVMRKLIHIVFGVLKHEKPYDPSLV